MKHSLSWELVKHFSRKQTFAFTIQDVVREFPVHSPNHLARMLAHMVKEKILCKISRSVYHIIPLTKDPNKYWPDPYQLTKYYCLHKNYYIGYFSALRINGLTSLSRPDLQVVTLNQVKPGRRNLGGIECRFIQLQPGRFFGFNRFHINPHEQAMVSDLEKTLVDISTNPCLCGGIAELGRAILKARKRIIDRKLFYYFERNGSVPAKKRFLYLTYLLNQEWSSEHERMRESLGKTIVLLDKAAPDQGRILIKFGLKINVDPSHLRKEIYHG